MEKAILGMLVASTHTRIYVLDRLVLDMKTGPRRGGVSTMRQSIRGSAQPNCMTSSGAERTTMSLSPLKV